MAFDRAYFNPGVANGGKGIKQHTYSESGTAINTIVASGYFNTVQGHINTGDLIWIYASNAVTCRQMTNTAGVITCSSTAVTVA